MTSPIALAKQSLDIGLYTDDTEGSLAFYRDGLGLPYEELLKISKGSRQHRLGLLGSVLKVNEARDSLDVAPSGFRRFALAMPALRQPATRIDPQGVPVELVHPGTNDITAVGITMAVADVSAQVSFLTDGLGGEALSSASADGAPRVRIGTTVITVEHDAAAADPGPQRALGFRYVTIQIHDVRAAHAHVLGLGFAEGLAPVRLGDTAAISFVRDGGANWWELSQRANLTGPLPQF